MTKEPRDAGTRLHVPISEANESCTKRNDNAKREFTGSFDFAQDDNKS